MAQDYSITAGHSVQQRQQVLQQQPKKKQTLHDPEWWMDSLCGLVLWWMAALTGDGGAVPLRIRHQQLVLQTATADSLRSNQNQRLPSEGRDLGNLFIDPELVTVEF